MVINNREIMNLRIEQSARRGEASGHIYDLSLMTTVTVNCGWYLANYPPVFIALTTYDIRFYNK